MNRSKPLVVAVLGTSLTARGAWFADLSVSLAESLRRPIDAMNFAQVGATSRWGVTRAAAVAQARPDVVIVEFATNDAAVHRRVSLAQSAANLAWIIERIRREADDCRIYLMTMSPVRGLRALIRPRLRRYYEIYPHTAQHHHVGLIDNRGDWALLSTQSLARAIPDGSHPIPEFSRSITLVNVVQTLTRDLETI